MSQVKLFPRQNIHQRDIVSKKRKKKKHMVVKNTEALKRLLKRAAVKNSRLTYFISGLKIIALFSLHSRAAQL